MFYFCFALHTPCRLNIITFASKIANEINLVLLSNLLAVFISNDNRHYTNIYIETTYTQFVVNDILHNMAIIGLTEIQSCIA